jgi:hypothetical protein
MNLLNASTITWLKGAVAAAANTDDDSAIFDSDGFESVTFVASITDSVSGGVATLTVEQNSANSASGMAALSGGTDTMTSASNDDLNGLCLKIEVVRPRERYLRVNRASATQNIAFGDVIAIGIPHRKQPSSHTGTVVLSPAES